MTDKQIEPCPFCGSGAELILRGNDATKKRSAEIECNSCHAKQVTAAIHGTLEWCERKAIEKWNRRAGLSKRDDLENGDSKQVEINFADNLLAIIKVKGTIEVVAAMDGWGNAINLKNIIVTNKTHLETSSSNNEAATLATLRSTDETGIEQHWKERLNYVIENGTYCGHLVNLPIVAEGETLDALKHTIKIMANAWVKKLVQMMQQDEPFEIINIEK